MRRLLALAAALAVAGASSGCGVFGGSDTKTFSAEFDRAIGVYVHSDVRVLGVRIGEVTKIVPKGTKVRLEMEYDASYKIPKDAKAVLLSPSIVSDRYVQLTPVYTSGDTLPDGVALGLDRTASPVELDEIYSNLDELNVALGPNGANKDGALSDLLAVSADNLRGNGGELNSTLTGLSTAIKTLADNRNDLFGTLNNLQDFTTTLAGSDSTIRAFNRDLASVAAQLNGERDDLALAVKQLGAALAEVSAFVKDNRDDLTANVTDLAEVTKVLVKQQRSLREFLDTAPTALSNLQLAYNPKSGTLDTRDNSNAQGGLPGVLCGLLAGDAFPAALCDAIGGLPVPKAKAGPSAAGDPTLGGILEVTP